MIPNLSDPKISRPGYPWLCVSFPQLPSNRLEARTYTEETEPLLRPVGCVSCHLSPSVWRDIAEGHAPPVSRIPVAFRVDMSYSSRMEEYFSSRMKGHASLVWRHVPSIWMIMFTVPYEESFSSRMKGDVPFYEGCLQSVWSCENAKAPRWYQVVSYILTSISWQCMAYLPSKGRRV